MGTVPAPGIVNSLQFLSPPKGFTEKATWAAPMGHHSTTEDTLSQPESVGTARRKASAIGTDSVLLVAGMGQEHRFGRWIKLKGDGVVNGTLVLSFSPRTPITN
jgi:ribosomal RNA-processing protein 9